MTRITQNIHEAIIALQNNEPVALPTETVYGLAANASSDEAIKRVFKAKNRPADHPLIVHIGQQEAVYDWVDDLPEMASRLIDKFWPGPLTLVLPKKSHVSRLITGGLDTVAIRMPSHPIMRELLQRIDFALVAPSANAFTQISPTCAAHVLRSLGGRIPIVLDGGSCAVGIESTIVTFDDNKPLILRHGAISSEEIREVLGEINEKTEPSIKLRAPGMHAVHYAPRTACYHVNRLNNEALAENLKIGIITLLPQPNQLQQAVYRSLSEHGDLKEAIRNFYAILHEMDLLGLDMIVIETVPNLEEGRALNDRIYRASQPIKFNSTQQ